MRLLVSGYRYYSNRKVIEAELLKFLSAQETHTIIHGGCSGVDKIAGQIAAEHKWNIQVYPYLKEFGLAGGPLRNEQMVREGKPTYAILFLSKESRGTKHMLSILQREKVPHTIIQV